MTLSCGGLELHLDAGLGDQLALLHRGSGGIKSRGVDDLGGTLAKVTARNGNNVIFGTAGPLGFVSAVVSFRVAR